MEFFLWRFSCLVALVDCLVDCMSFIPTYKTQRTECVNKEINREEMHILLKFAYGNEGEGETRSTPAVIIYTFLISRVNDSRISCVLFSSPSPLSWKFLPSPSHSFP